jgi:hypothetical protein
MKRGFAESCAWTALNWANAFKQVGICCTQSITPIGTWLSQDKVHTDILCRLVLGLWGIAGHS